jgi:SAM-dependent methyltransferase
MKNFEQNDKTWMDSTLLRQVKKATQYVLHGDLGGLNKEVKAYMQWRRQRNLLPAASVQLPVPMLVSLQQSDKMAASGSPALEVSGHQKSESEYWDEADINLIRHASWLSAGNGALGQWALDALCTDHHGDVSGTILAYLGGKPLTDLRGLILGCGDMQAEHGMFCDPRLQFSEIDAHDISPASIERARQLTNERGLNVNYYVSDINLLELPADKYDLVICFYAYHHFQEVDRIAAQINKSLRKKGVFFTIDYVGERQQQFSSEQMFFANQFLQLLPKRFRRELDGRERQEAQRIPVEFFSPDEAIYSDKILDAIDGNLNVLCQYNWAGLLMPLLEGLGFNISTEKGDMDLLRFLFEIDQALVNAGKIGPNFTMTMAGKK